MSWWVEKVNDGLYIDLSHAGFYTVVKEEVENGR